VLAPQEGHTQILSANERDEPRYVGAVGREKQHVDLAIIADTLNPTSSARSTTVG
jgi:hypothetical protein